jgi:hypothetical protein
MQLVGYGGINVTCESSKNECLCECISTWREERKEGEQQLSSTGKKERASPQNNQTQMFHHQGSDQSMAICTSLVPTGRAGLLNRINRSGR